MAKEIGQAGLLEELSTCTVHGHAQDVAQVMCRSSVHIALWFAHE